MVTNGNDQKAENTNKKPNTNIDIYLDSIKGYEEELAAFDNAVEEAFVSCNRKSEINIVGDKSLEVLEINNKDD